MKPHHVLIVFMVTAHVFVALTVVAGIRLPGSFGDWLPLAVVSTGQIGLLSIWTALGRRAMPWRPTVLIAAIIAWCLIDAAKSGGSSNMMFLFLPVVAATLVILCVSRLLGLRISFCGDENTDDRGPWQFSLRQMFACTTSLAVCLGLLIETFRHLHIGHFGNRPGEFVLTTALITGVVLISMMLAWFQLHLRNIVFLALLAPLMAILFRYSCYEPRMYAPLVAYCALTTVFLVASLLVFRVAGYRLEMKKRP